MVGTCLGRAKSRPPSGAACLDLDRTAIARVTIDALIASTGELYANQLRSNSFAEIANEIAVQREVEIDCRVTRVQSVASFDQRTDLRG